MVFVKKFKTKKKSNIFKINEGNKNRKNYNKNKLGNQNKIKNNYDLTSTMSIDKINNLKEIGINAINDNIDEISINNKINNKKNDFFY